MAAATHPNQDRAAREKQTPKTRQQAGAQPGWQQQNLQEQIRYVAPRVNIFETDDAVTIEAEMPGVKKEGVEIEIDENELCLKGHRAKRDGAGEGQMRFQERPPADFARTFMLGRAVDRERIEAKMNDGLLCITLHKAERVKKRNVKIE